MNLRNTQRGVFFVKFKRRFRERLVQCRGKEERESERESLSSICTWRNRLQRDLNNTKSQRIEINPIPG